MKTKDSETVSSCVICAEVLRECDLLFVEKQAEADALEVSDIGSPVCEGCYEWSVDPREIP